MIVLQAPFILKPNGIVCNFFLFSVEVSILGFLLLGNSSQAKIEHDFPVKNYEHTHKAILAESCVSDGISWALWSNPLLSTSPDRTFALGFVQSCFKWLPAEPVPIYQCSEVSCPVVSVILVGSWLWNCAQTFNSSCLLPVLRACTSNSAFRREAEDS